MQQKKAMSKKHAAFSSEASKQTVFGWLQAGRTGK